MNGASAAGEYAYDVNGNLKMCIRDRPYIDSIYKGKVENLISFLFNEKGVLSVGLSYPEEKMCIRDRQFNQRFEQGNHRYSI